MLIPNGFGATHPGLVRPNNEDWLLVREPSSPDEEFQYGALYAICDGIGGEKSGEVASRLAIDTLNEEYFNNRRFLDAKNSFVKSLKAANKKVFFESKNRTQLHGMGTTLTSLLIMQNKVFLGHAGDSRAYLFRNNKMIQLSSDHSNIQGALFKSLGVEKEMTFDVTELQPEDNDWFFICCDGIYNALGNNFQSIIRDGLSNKKQSPENVCKHLIYAALPHSRDNLTIIAIHITESYSFKRGKIKLRQNKKRFNHRSKNPDVEKLKIYQSNSPISVKSKKKVWPFIAAFIFVAMIIIAIPIVLLTKHNLPSSIFPKKILPTLNPQIAFIAPEINPKEKKVLEIDGTSLDSLSRYGLTKNEKILVVNSIKEGAENHWFISFDTNETILNQFKKLLDSAFPPADAVILIPKIAFKEEGMSKFLRKVFEIPYQIFKREEDIEWNENVFLQKLQKELYSDSIITSNKIEIWTDFPPEKNDSLHNNISGNLTFKQKNKLPDRLFLIDRRLSEKSFNKLSQYLITTSKISPNFIKVKSSFTANFIQGTLNFNFTKPNNKNRDIRLTLTSNFPNRRKKELIVPIRKQIISLPREKFTFELEKDFDKIYKLKPNSVTFTSKNKSFKIKISTIKKRRVPAPVKNQKPHIAQKAQPLNANDTIQAKQQKRLLPPKADSDFKTKSTQLPKNPGKSHLPDSAKYKETKPVQKRKKTTPKRSISNFPPSSSSDATKWLLNIKQLKQFEEQGQLIWKI